MVYGLGSRGLRFRVWGFGFSAAWEIAFWGSEYVN